jgi:hypothetical protein
MPQRSDAGSTGPKPKRAVKSGRSGPKTPARWTGDAVEPSGSAGSSAEEAAARAEGNAPLRADAAAAGEDRGTFLERGPRRQPSPEADDAENAEEKRQSAAEDHAQRLGQGPMHGKL